MTNNLHLMLMSGNLLPKKRPHAILSHRCPTLNNHLDGLLYIRYVFSSPNDFTTKYLIAPTLCCHDMYNNHKRCFGLSLTQTNTFPTQLVQPDYSIIM